MIDRVSTPSSTKPLQVTLEVEKQLLTIEVDTGAVVSLMSEEEHHQRWLYVSLETAEVSSGSWSKEGCRLLWSADSTAATDGGGGR